MSTTRQTRYGPFSPIYSLETLCARVGVVFNQIISGIRSVKPRPSALGSQQEFRPLACNSEMHTESAKAERSPSRPSTACKVKYQTRQWNLLHRTAILTSEDA